MMLVFLKADVITAMARYARCTESSIKLSADMPEVCGECDNAPAIPTTGRPRGKRAQKPVEKTYPTAE